MAFFQTGHVYVGGEQVTHTKLNEMVNDAIPINFDRSAFGVNSQIITVGVGKPSSPDPGEMAYDTSEAALFVFHNGVWLGIAPKYEQHFTAGVNLNAGDVVGQDTGPASTVSTINADGHPRVIGINTVAVTGAPTTARIQVAGVASVNCSGTVSIGDYLMSSTAPGLAVRHVEGSGAVFAVAMTSQAGGAGSVQALLLPAKPVTRTVVTTAYATYSFAAALTDGSWFDVPNGAVGGAITTNGSSAMKVQFTTTHAGQYVGFRVNNMSMVTSTGASSGHFDGVRICLDATSTVLVGWTKPNQVTADPTAGQVIPLGGPLIWQTTAGTNKGFSLIDYYSEFAVPNAGAHSIFIQFLAGGTLTYTAAQNFTATLQAQLLYA